MDILEKTGLRIMDPEAPEEIEWRPLPEHPDPALYRAAGGALGGLALFVGGTETPYNYDGEGYDGTPAEPIRQALAWVPATRSWRLLFAPPVASMDHRSLGVALGGVFLVGGMEEGREVSNKVWWADGPSGISPDGSGFPPVLTGSPRRPRGGRWRPARPSPRRSPPPPPPSGPWSRPGSRTRGSPPP